MSRPLSDEAIQLELSSLPGWDLENGKLVKSFRVKDFREAISLIVRMSFECEELDHHPEIYNVYNTVKISLTTHDAGDLITEKDILLARKIQVLI